MRGWLGVVRGREETHKGGEEAEAHCCEVSAKD